MKWINPDTGKVTSFDITKALAEKHSKDFFLTEVKSGSTWYSPVGDMKRLDALAIRKSWAYPCFTGYEVKVSRSDFLRDNKFYTYEELVNCLYIVCPKDMVSRTELPESVGLMYYYPDKKTLITKKKAIYRKIEYSPDMLRYIIYSRLDSDRIPFFSDRKGYFEAYVAEKMDCRYLGNKVRSKLVSDNADMKRRLDELQTFEEAKESYNAIRQILHKHKIWGLRAGGLAHELDEALSRTCQEDISSIRKTLEVTVERIKRMEEGLS